MTSLGIFSYTKILFALLGLMDWTNIRRGTAKVKWALDSMRKRGPEQITVHAISNLSVHYLSVVAALGSILSMPIMGCVSRTETTMKTISNAECFSRIESMDRVFAQAPVNQLLLMPAAMRNIELPSATIGSRLDRDGVTLMMLEEDVGVWIDGDFYSDYRARRILADRVAMSNGNQTVPVYIVADGDVSLSRIASVLYNVEKSTQTRIVLRYPKVTYCRGCATRVTQAMEATSRSRDTKEASRAIRYLFHHYLSSCPFEQDLFEEEFRRRHQITLTYFRKRLLQALRSCRCNGVDLDAIEQLTYELGGTPDLRWMPLQLDFTDSPPDEATAWDANTSIKRVLEFRRLPNPSGDTIRVALRVPRTDTENQSGEKAIVDAIKQQLQEIRNCYERLLKVDARIEGKVTIGFTVDETGRVATVRIKGNTSNSILLADCVAAIISRIIIKPPPPDDVPEWTYPFVFAPQN